MISASNHSSFVRTFFPFYFCGRNSLRNRTTCKAWSEVGASDCAFGAIFLLLYLQRGVGDYWHLDNCSRCDLPEETWHSFSYLCYCCCCCCVRSLLYLFLEMVEIYTSDHDVNNNYLSLKNVQVSDHHHFFFRLNTAELFFCLVHVDAVF